MPVFGCVLHQQDHITRQLWHQPRDQLARVPAQPYGAGSKPTIYTQFRHRLWHSTRISIQDLLSQAPIDRLDAELLLAHVLQRDRTWLHAHATDDVDSSTQTAFAALVKRRKQHEPVAYITGTKEFYGLSFLATPAVLIPRPATESLVAATLALLNGQETREEPDTQITVFGKQLGDIADVQTIVDIGTGSGCIPVALATERPDLQLIATDISPDALAVAQQNAEQHGCQIDLRQGSLLEPIADLDTPFILVSNPPYIPAAEQLMPDVADYEPALALKSGNRGTDVLQPLLAQAAAHPYCRGIAIECRTEQADEYLENC